MYEDISIYRLAWATGKEPRVCIYKKLSKWDRAFQKHKVPSIQSMKT